MQITVHLRSDVAHSLAKRSSPSPDSEELVQLLSRFGLALQPLHPGVDDPELRTHFWTDVPDQITAERVLQQLLQRKAIQAAYLKPPDAMP